MRAVAIFDVDGFKNINDEYGHGIGDEYLMSAAKRLMNAVSSADLVSRWGGDEFLVVITGAVADPFGIVERALSQVTGWPYATTAGLIHASLCVGVAEVQQGELRDDAIERADGALYDAKDAGDGRALLAANPAPTPPPAPPTNRPCVTLRRTIRTRAARRGGCCGSRNGC